MATQALVLFSHIKTEHAALSLATAVYSIPQAPKNVCLVI